MAWLYIPAETGERIETICNQHYNPGRGACDCPLWPACSYSNDLTKSNAENTRIFEQGMAADLSYYGKHYFLRPLRDDLPQLHGRGISYDEERNTYTVTTRAYDKLKEQYRIRYETCLD